MTESKDHIEFRDSLSSPTSTNGFGGRIYITLPWKPICNVAISLPLTALFSCLISAYFIHPSEKIQERSCQIGEEEDDKIQVFNFVPSISSIIGIYPQCYIWRLFTAFHLGPRLVLPYVYYRYYLSHLINVPLDKRRLFHLLNKAVMMLSSIETVAFTFISYISNRENYPIHEKSFVTYLLSSNLWMMLTLFLYPLAKPQRTPREEKSFKLKKIIFWVVIISCFVMFSFYYVHMQYCIPLAFSAFAFLEYVISCMNMVFHYTLNLDFGDELLVIGNMGKAITSNGKKFSNGSTEHLSIDGSNSKYD